MPEPLERAEILMSLQRFAEALPLLQTALSLRPEDMETLAYMGWASYGVGDAESGKLYLDLALKVPPQTTYEMALRTTILQSQGRRQEALLSAEEAVRLDPQNETTLDLLAQSQARCGKIKDARSTATQIISRNPDSDAAYRVLGFTSMRRFRWREAERWYNEALRCNPEAVDMQALRGLAIMLQRKRLDEGLASVSEAHKQAPNAELSQDVLQEGVIFLLLPPWIFGFLTVFLCGVGLCFYLLMAVQIELPRWVALIVAGVTFWKNAPFCCLPKEGCVLEQRRRFYEKLPPIMRHYVARSERSSVRFVLDVMVWLASLATIGTMICWTIFGPPVPFWNRFGLNDKRLVAALMICFVFAAIVVRKMWASTFVIPEWEAGKASAAHSSADMRSPVLAGLQPLKNRLQRYLDEHPVTPPNSGTG